MIDRPDPAPMDPATQGFSYWNPDTGHEWSPNHPVDSGEVSDATLIQAMTLAEFRMLFPTEERDPTFREELQTLINRHSKENGSNTPDFILAEYLEGCLDNFDRIMMKREVWYGRGPEPVFLAVAESERPTAEDINRITRDEYVERPEPKDWR